MKRSFITLLLLCMIGSILLAGASGGRSCEIEVLGHIQESNSWCWATCISIATYYFTGEYTNSQYSQCEIVTWACKSGLLDPIYSVNCNDCCGFWCLDYAPTGSQFETMLGSSKWGFVHSRENSPYNFDNVETHICASKPVIITFCDGFQNHSTVAKETIRLLYNYTICHDPYDAEEKWWSCGEIEGRSGYGDYYAGDYIGPNVDNEYPQNPRARVTYFLPVLEEGGVKIEWQTRAERDSDFFQIQKCYDKVNKHFTTISGRIYARGGDLSGAVYQYIDPDGAADDIYRLVEYETNGRRGIQRYSKVRPVRPSEISIASARDHDLDAIRQETAQLLADYARIRPLKSPAAQNITWLAIYPQAFQYDVNQLIYWRTLYNGFGTAGITTEEIESTYGTIKDYIQHLWDIEAHSLKYVFLIGDASSCDYSTYCDSTTHDIIPTYRYEDGFDGYPYYSDLEYGDMDGDGYPEIAIGRIPAATTADAAAYIDKVIYYEQHQNGGWTDEVSFLINDKNINFCSGAYVDSLATLLTDLIPHDLDLHYISMDDEFPSGWPDYGAREAIAIDEFDDGRSLILSLGSIASECSFTWWLITAWYEDNPFRIEKLYRNWEFPFVVGASCDIGNFTRDWADESYPPITEELLFDDDRGAIAMFAPTSATMQQGNYELCAMLLQYLYDWGAPSLGHACMAAQKRVMAYHSMSETTARSYVLLGDPAIRLVESVYNSTGESECLVTSSYYFDKSFFFGCPAGDAESMVIQLNFEFDYGSSPSIPADDITLEYDSGNAPFVLFTSGDITADSAATSGNNFQTTITHSTIGGCGCGDLYVLVSGDTVGAIRLCFRSCDINGDGSVDLSDFSFFGDAFNSCIGDPDFDHCCDFNDDDCCNLSDYAFFGEHYQHYYNGGQGAAASAGLESDAILELCEAPRQNGRDPDLLPVLVRLDNAEDVSMLSFMLRTNGGTLQYRDWFAGADVTAGVFVAPVTREDGNALFVTIIAESPITAADSELLTLEFAAGDDKTALSPGDFSLVCGEVMGTESTVKRLQRLRVGGGSEEMPPHATYLGTNYPNPFNPSTVITYGIARSGWVNLSIYNVNGQLIRTLVDDNQRPDTYSVVWNGTDNMNRNVASGIYFYKLETVDYTATKKCALLR